MRPEGPKKNFFETGPNLLICKALSDNYGQESASYPDVSLDVRAKEGGKETMGETSGRSCFQDGGKSDGGPIYNF